jgi:3-dehydroquinate synthase
VVGDIAGFVAATYLRGIPWIQVPTTLLAQVDSSVGGKTGVNHPAGKNLIGAFYQPRLVLIDPDLLGSLPPRELHAGLAEVVKAALIGDAQLFSLLEAHWEGFVSGDPELLEEAILRACRVKAEVVSRDEREAGHRRILNFGHTLGHALEAATEYRHFLHGEAVAWGMLGAIWLSWKRGLLNDGERGRIEALLSRLPKPPIPEIPTERFREHLRRDKKIVAGTLHYVYLSRIGEAVLEEGISEEELLSALERISSLEAPS